MKDFDKLTNEEIRLLTDEQIAIYKKLKWAENGIKFPVKPNEPECVEEDKPDLTAYYISELGDNVLFLSLEEAMLVTELCSLNPAQRETTEVIKTSVSKAVRFTRKSCSIRWQRTCRRTRNCAISTRKT